MGCRESKERVPPPVSGSTYAPSTYNGVPPRKPADTASKGALSVTTGCVDDGAGVLEHPTPSNSQGVRTPPRGRHSDGSRIDDCGLPHDAALDETVKGQSSSAVASPALQPPPASSGTPLHAPPADGERGDRQPSLQQQQRGTAAATSTSPAPIMALNALSPASCLSTPVVCTPTATSPTSQATRVSAAVPLSLGGAADTTPLLLLPAPVHSTSDATSPALTGVSRSSDTGSGASGHQTSLLRRRESSTLTDCDHGGDSCDVYSRGDLGGMTATALLNSTSLLHTIASTQPPSALASRSASVQPASMTTMPAVVVTEGMDTPLPIATLPPSETAPERCHASEASMEPPATRNVSPRTGEAPRLSQTPSSFLADVDASATSGVGTAPVGATTAASDEWCSNGDGHSSAPTQCPSAVAEVEEGAAGEAQRRSIASPAPQQQAQQQPLPEHPRSPSGLHASPRPRSPVQLVSPHRLSAALPPPPSAIVGTLSVSAIAMEASDAPEDVPLPEIDHLFTISPLCTHAGQAGGATSALMGSITSVSGSGQSSPPPRQSGSPGMRSPATQSMAAAVEGDGVCGAGAGVASPSAGSAGLTSPFTAHLHTHSNSLVAYNVHGSASWFVVDANGNAGAANGSTAGNTPPTNSELVRQINQPTTNIRSILRKRTSSATTLHSAQAAATDSDGVTATTTMAGTSGVHSRVLSLSLNNLGGSSSSPRLVTADGRLSGSAASPSDVAVRTDFVTSRHSVSDIDAVSPVGSHLPVLTPSPRGGTAAAAIQVRSPPSSWGLYVDASPAAAPLCRSGETSLSATTSNSGNYLSIAGSGVATGDGARNYVTNGVEAERAGGVRRSPSLRAGSHRSPATPGASPPRRPERRASADATSAYSSSSNRGGERTSERGLASRAKEGSEGGGASSLAASSASPLPVAARTSDEPPPDIMLVSPPKRVHVVV